MAEVLSPHMQSSSTITMLHSRPSSADAFQGSQQQRSGPSPRSMYNGQSSTYRGVSVAPVQPYAFQSTPSLRSDVRVNSAPSTSHGLSPSHKPTPSASTNSSETSTQSSTKDDSILGSRPVSLINLSSQLPDLSFTSFEPPAKASPDRYRRPAAKRNESSHVGTTKPPSPRFNASPADGTFANPTKQSPQPVQRQTSVDDMAMPKTSQSELAKRYRRRSLNQLETSTVAQSVSGGSGKPTADTTAMSTPTAIRPVDLQKSIGDGEPRSGASAISNKPPRQSQPTKTAEKAAEASVADVTAGASAEAKVNVPPRGSSEPSKRLAAPSPLSRQATDESAAGASAPGTAMRHKTYAAAAQSAVNPTVPSVAAQHLAAVSDRDLNKGMKSRLRRAFSFGTAQELRRAAGENNQAAAQTAQHAKEQHRQQIDDEMDAEQLEIARRQEAAGIGAGIYSGQGGFTGSTDNLSISSTASSASMMLRKMGRGAKKGAKSIRGIFRPKSVVGVPAADGPSNVGSSVPLEPSVAEVSMVTVEAERLKVNVNAHPDERTGGGTGFPKLERNSMEVATGVLAADARPSADGSDSHSRRSIVGSDKDRAEVLAAVKKGILKRSGSGSPCASPSVRPVDAGLTPVPHILESPASSMPSTPRDGPQNRSVSAPGDYFNNKLSLSKSMPNTPNGSVRSISFSPRIQFHDVWSSAEYDRRGEIATCNRLTPMLAQQIKEELNTFKMEMEVHELSKPHTHFF